MASRRRAPGRAAAVGGRREGLGRIWRPAAGRAARTAPGLAQNARVQSPRTWTGCETSPGQNPVTRHSRRVNATRAVGARAAEHALSAAFATSATAPPPRGVRARWRRPGAFSPAFYVAIGAFAEQCAGVPPTERRPRAGRASGAFWPGARTAGQKFMGTGFPGQAACLGGTLPRLQHAFNAGHWPCKSQQCQAALASLVAFPWTLAVAARVENGAASPPGCHRACNRARVPACRLPARPSATESRLQGRELERWNEIGTCSL